MFSDDPEEDLGLLTYIHDEIIEVSGGAKGMHDEKLVRSALARPLHSVLGEDAYKSDYARAAALLDSIANNHGFRDGNKRTAMAAATYYLDNHDIAVDYTNTEYEEFMLHVVKNKPTIEHIAEWLAAHGRKMPATPWTFVDAEMTAKQYPDSFEIPTAEEIATVDKGSLVKLIFEIVDPIEGEPIAERMWVIVTQRKGDNFIGILDNDPFYIRGLYAEDKVEFKAKNIISINSVVDLGK